MNFNFAFFVKTLMKYSNVRNETNEEFVNDFLDILVTNRNLEDKNGEIFILNKSRISLLLGNKQNIPNVLSNEVDFLRQNKSIKNEYIEYLKELLDKKTINKLIDEIDGKCESDDHFKKLA